LNLPRWGGLWRESGPKCQAGENRPSAALVATGVATLQQASPATKLMQVNASARTKPPMGGRCSVGFPGPTPDKHATGVRRARSPDATQTRCRSEAVPRSVVTPVTTNVVPNSEHTASEANMRRAQRPDQRRAWKPDATGQGNENSGHRDFV